MAVQGSDPPTRVPVQSFLAGFKSRIPARSTPVPFARTATVRIAGNGIIYGNADQFEYLVYSREGELLRTVRAEVPPLPIRAADRARARDAFIGVQLANPTPVEHDDDRNPVYLRPDQVRRFYGRAFDELELPETTPAYGALRAEEDGSVWVGKYYPRGDTLSRQWWAKFDSEGKLPGTLHIPMKQTVVRFTRGHVILRYEDPRDGFHIVAVHRIVPQ